MTSQTLPVPRGLEPLQRVALRVGAGGLVVTALLGLRDPALGLRAWLYAFLFWCGLAVGCLSLSMIHNLTGGYWGLVIRRILEAGTRTFPLLALSFLPLAGGLRSLYVWADPELVAADPLLRHKALYLNRPFFLGRAVFYFAVWMVLAHFLNKWSRELDAGPNLKLERRQRSLGGGGLVLLGLTITFAAVDWTMSLNPHWFSTIWGVAMMVGQVLSALCLMVLLLAYLAREAPLKTVVTPGVVHDLGKLMLAFTMLWAYVHLSQFLIIWAGNVAEETPFYLTRLSGGWEAVGIVLLLFHFVLPFLLLLSRDLKRNARSLALLSAFMLVMRLLDLYWMIGPDLAPHSGHGSAPGARFQLLELAAVLGLGGSWLYFFLERLKDRPILPLGDPEIRERLLPAVLEVP